MRPNYVFTALTEDDLQCHIVVTDLDGFILAAPDQEIFAYIGENPITVKKGDLHSFSIYKE